MSDIIQDYRNFDSNVHPIYYYILDNLKNVPKLNYDLKILNNLSLFLVLFYVNYSREDHITEITHYESVEIIKGIAEKIFLLLGVGLAFVGWYYLAASIVAMFAIYKVVPLHVSDRLTHLLKEIPAHSSDMVEFSKLVSKHKTPEIESWVTFVVNNRKVITYADLIIVKALIEIEKEFIDSNNNIKSYNEFISTYAK